MIETEQRSLPGIDLPKEVTFYISRMTDIFQLRDHIEKYPFERFAELEYRNAEQLIKKTIFHTYSMLCTLGYNVEADFLLNADRQLHERKAV